MKNKQHNLDRNNFILAEILVGLLLFFVVLVITVRKQDEVNERAQRDRERSQMEGRIAAQMERSNALMEAMKALMESVVTSNEVLHADLANSQARSQGMAAKVDHIADRVDLLYKESAR